MASSPTDSMDFTTENEGDKGTLAYPPNGPRSAVAVAISWGMPVRLKKL